MKKEYFYYELPEELVAQSPLKARAESRLLCLDRKTGETTHRHFYDIVDLFEEGDVLVLNNTKVIPARLFAAKSTGTQIEVFLLAEEDGQWRVLMKPGRRVKKGTVLFFAGSEMTCEAVDDPNDTGSRYVVFSYSGAAFWEEVERIGHMPLPPYVKRADGEEDKDEYQTVFARERGAVAAPTAGLHFTEPLLAAIKEKGVIIVTVTLHVGYGTFKPVDTDNIEDHPMHTEWCSVPDVTANAVNAAKKEGRRVLACGTTVVRTLESRVQASGLLIAGDHETNIFIYPPYDFKLIDGVITNFHLPYSTLLMLVSAFAGRENVLAAYAEAVQYKYRFYSYGDAMFIS